jgi:Fe-S cluster assembly protein SufD
MSFEEEMPFSVYSDGLLNALKDGCDALKGQLPIGDDAFAMLNSAYMLDGAVLRVAEGEKLKKPIHIVSIVSPEADGLFLSPRIAIKINAGAEASIIETELSLDGVRYFANRMVHVYLGEGASLSHCRYLAFSSASCEVESVQATLEAGASYSLYGYLGRAGIFDGRSRVALAGDARSTLHFAAAAGGGSDVSYSAPAIISGSGARAESNMSGVAADSSHISFSTSLSTERGVADAYARQLSKILLVSENARGRIRPVQSIASEGVEAFHGASVAGIGEEEMFFLNSRGISRGDAGDMLKKSLLSAQFSSLSDMAAAAEYARLVWGENP